MREIKFRAKRLDNEQWLNGSLMSDPYRGEAEISDHDDINLGRYDVDPETVGQYTGLKDKNGVDVYEGDIVECVSWNEYFSIARQPIEHFRRKMYVDFRKGGFKMVELMPEPMEDNEWDIIYNGDIEVIGNIHDNPELLDNEHDEK